MFIDTKTNRITIAQEQLNTRPQHNTYQEKVTKHRTRSKQTIIIQFLLAPPRILYTTISISCYLFSLRSVLLPFFHSLYVLRALFLLVTCKVEGCQVPLLQVVDSLFQERQQLHGYLSKLSSAIGCSTIKEEASIRAFIAKE